MVVPFVVTPKSRKNGKVVIIVTVKNDEITTIVSIKGKMEKKLWTPRKNACLWYNTNSLVISDMDKVKFINSNLYKMRIDTRRLYIRDCDMNTSYLKQLWKGPLNKGTMIQSMTLRPLYRDENLTFSLLFNMFPKLNDLSVNGEVIHQDWVADVMNSRRNDLLSLTLVNKHGGFTKLFSFSSNSLYFFVDSQPRGFHLRLIHWVPKDEDAESVESKVLELIDFRLKKTLFNESVQSKNTRSITIVLLNHESRLINRLNYTCDL